MRCPYLNYSRGGRSFCRCGTYPGRKTTVTATVLNIDYIDRFCLHNSEDCPYNPDRDKFVQKPQMNNNNYKKNLYNYDITRTEKLARKNISNSQTSSSNKTFIILIIIIAIIYLISR